MLAEKVLHGETDHFEELVRRYQQPVFAIIYRMTSQYQEAEDLTQEVFLNIYQKLYQFDTSKKFSPWIYRIAVNTCITAMRKKNKVVNINFDESYIRQYDTNINYHYTDPELVFARKELKEEIKLAIENLPPNYKSVIILRYQMDFNNQEIADILGVSKENVEVKVHRARKALRKIIIEKWEERGLKNELPAN